MVFLSGFLQRLGVKFYIKTFVIQVFKIVMKYKDKIGSM